MHSGSELNHGETNRLLVRDGLDYNDRRSLASGGGISINFLVGGVSDADGLDLE